MTILGISQYFHFFQIKQTGMFVVGYLKNWEHIIYIQKFTKNYL